MATSSRAASSIPTCCATELHRVWVVEATLRKGFSHPYAKRRFYLDEDSWQILAADIYDKDGVLTQAQEVHPINYYDVPLVSSTLEAIYDFKGGRYFVDGLDNNEPMYDFGVQVGPRDFTPQALRREGTEADGPQTISSAPRSVPSSSRRAGAGLICRYLMLSRGISSRSPSTSTLR